MSVINSAANALNLSFMGSGVKNLFFERQWIRCGLQVTAALAISKLADLNQHSPNDLLCYCASGLGGSAISDLVNQRPLEALLKIVPAFATMALYLENLSPSQAQENNFFVSILMISTITVVSGAICHVGDSVWDKIAKCPTIQRTSTAALASIQRFIDTVERPSRIFIALHHRFMGNRVDRRFLEDRHPLHI